MRWRLLPLVAVITLAACPGGASAAIARVDEFDPDYGACKADCPPPTFEVVLVANRGERNDVTAARDSGGTVVLHDAGAPIVAKTGCTSVDSNTVRCGDAQADLRVTVRDRDDVVTILDGYAKVEGGAGNDRLAGGPGADTLVGGPGNDELHGGAGDDRLMDGVVRPRRGSSNDDSFDGGDGSDWIDYSGRLFPVTIDLRPGHTTGQRGERDTLSAIENATGGTAGDTITGDDAKNELDGGAGPGADVVRGGAGDDTVRAASGDRVYGGPGRDWFPASYDASGGSLLRINCGADPDTVDAAGAAALVGDSCEVVTGFSSDLFRHHLPLRSFDDPVLTYEQYPDNPGSYWTPDSKLIEIRVSGIAAHKRHPKRGALLAAGISGTADKFDLHLTQDGIALLRRYGRIRARVFFDHTSLGYMIDLRGPAAGSA